MTTTNPSSGASTRPVEPGPGPSHGSGSRSEERSLGEIVASASEHLSTLLHQEVELAKAEIKQEVSVLGKGVGALGAAGALGGVGGLHLTIGLACVIGAQYRLSVGFFAVGVLFLLLAAVLALIGKKSVGKVSPPVRTIQTVKDDVAFARHPTGGA